MTRASGDGSLIAVVGMSCRLPHAPDLDAYWELLSDGRDAISEIPDERWEMAGRSVGEGLSDEVQGAGFGAFLEQVDAFDSAFFGISPREAEAMDPQQRLALELGWEALEDARIVAGSVRGNQAGVFVGAISGDYEALSRRCGVEAVGRHTEVGLERSLIANRVSYALGINGPSLTVDTGQSSSLAAVHLACESLRRGESTLALAGGVHLNLDPISAIGASRLGGLSPDGRCFTFDARANGYVKGEGGGIVVLKPLGAARADGDRVRCVIRASAMNNGAGASLAVPGRAAQERMLKRAYRRAGLRGSEVQYVELHGSGTPVGDPIEAASLGAVLGRERADRDPLPVGSAKTNIGHLEGAGGIAGLIKTALAIEHRQLPASLNFESPNPEIPLAGQRLRVQAAPGPWPHEDRPLAAGVNSFGVGGTNCHVVIAEAPRRPDRTAAAGSVPLPGATPLLLSAKTPMALRAQAQRLKMRLEAEPEPDLADVAYSLATTREAFAHRAVVVGSEREELLAGLAAAGSGEAAAGLVRGRAAPGARPILLFPGYGSQWEGMALGLLESSPVFARSMRACAEALEPYIEWSLDDVLRGAERAPPLDRADVGQPALFATMVSLAELWRSMGVEPGAVVGHSQGEIVAAHVAGALSLEDAARVVVLRNKALLKLVGRGAMAAVALSAELLEERLAQWQGRLEVAALNGPASAVVSGDPDALDEFVAGCREDDVRARKVRGAVAASHSAQVEAVREEMLADLAPIRPRSGRIPFHSTVTGEVLDTAELDAEYWYRNARHTVRLEPVVRVLLERGEQTLIEVSPHPVLTLGLQEAIEAAAPKPEAVSLLGSLKRGEGGPERFVRSLAEAHAAGVGLDWEAFFTGSGAKQVGLPTYPFQRRRHWLGGSEQAEHRSISLDYSADTDVLSERSLAGLADEIANLPESQRGPRVLATVRSETAAILGHGDVAAIDVEKSFKDLGFDSPAAVELRNRLATASGLRLAATAVLDHPTPARLAAHILAEAGAGPAAISPALRTQASEEPIAIVGMACRYPGGADSPEGLWQLLAEGREGIGEFPADRGWDLERL
ncbi:MAG TPA: type I polyketide synthase, partial [Solirubrobacterales bacterium]|nr:type I polyketide synthase [Solirubrobacterales bacterium]